MTAVGRIPGILLTAHLWNNGNGITTLSYFWLTAILISAILWLVLYKYAQEPSRESLIQFQSTSSKHKHDKQNENESK